MFFEDMGVTYLGPVDGHDIEGLIKVIEEAKRVKGAVLVHVITQKGKGYGPAENPHASVHGAAPCGVAPGLFHCYVQAGPAGRTGSGNFGSQAGRHRLKAVPEDVPGTVL